MITRLVAYKFPLYIYDTMSCILTSPVETSQKDPEYSGRLHTHSPHIQAPRPLQTCYNE